MRHAHRRKATIWLLAMAVAMAMPGVALADDDKIDPVDTVVTEADEALTEDEVTEVLSSLPVLGTGLNLTIARDDEGEIASVALDPADGSTVIKERDHKMVFLLGDGDTRVVVKVRHDSIQTLVKADATIDVTGPGSWTADVFGNGLVTIPYTVSFDGNAPAIAIGEIVTPEGVSAEVGEPRARVSDEGDKASFKIKVRLVSGEEKAQVTLVAKTYVDDDGEVTVRLAVSLSERDRGEHRDRDDDDRREKSRYHDDDDGGDRDHDRDHDDHDDHDGHDKGDGDDA